MPLWLEFPMFAVLRHSVCSLIATVLLNASSADASAAGWITIRNDTTSVIVVQEVIVQDGQLKRLKPVRLLPGESVRQCEPTTGLKRFDIYDGKQPTSPLCIAELRITDDNQIYSVAFAGEKVAVREVHPSTVPSKRP